MNNTICYHHNDMDGHGAAWQVHLNVPDISPDNFVSKNYDSPFYKDHRDACVYIVDLSFTKETIKELFKICDVAKSVIWIDHHRSSLEAIEHHKNKIDQYENLIYLICENTSGCALSYIYFRIGYNKGFNIFKHGNVTVKTEFDKSCLTLDNNKEYCAIVELPLYIALISDYDCWIKYSPMSDLFNIGCSGKDIRTIIRDRDNKKIFNKDFWDNLPFDVNKRVKEGSIINDYLKTRYIREFKYGSFISTYKGKDILCMNSRGNSSVFGDEIHKYPMVVLFNYNGKKGFSYSLYSSSEAEDRFDCSEIAEQFGGGGHVGAAGFATDKMIFLPKPAQMEE